MAKRKALDALDVATGAKDGGTGDDEMVTTAIYIPRDLHRLLRSAAFATAQDTGGRPSVSAILVDLVERNRGALVKQAGPYYRP